MKTGRELQLELVLNQFIKLAENSTNFVQLVEKAKTVIAMEDDYLRYYRNDKT